MIASEDRQEASTPRPFEATSPDVVARLIAEGVIDKKPTSKRDLAAVQATFNRWRVESGRSLGAMSMILACSIDA